jgi:hypothetical protein
MCLARICGDGLEHVPCAEQARTAPYSKYLPRLRSSLRELSVVLLSTEPNVTASIADRDAQFRVVSKVMAHLAVYKVCF